MLDQSAYDLRCEWGEHGVARLASISDAVIIVDVLSFSTCVSIAVARGATVFPYRFRDDGCPAFARSVRAEMAGPRGKATYSLSPASLLDIPEGTRLVLPSPNGATLSLATGSTPTFAGCFRNARAVAEAARRCGRRIAVIPAGERWWPDGSLRVCLEDLAGAGAVLSHLPGELSPEARMAVAVYRQAAENLPGVLQECNSGRELCGRGYPADVDLAAQMDRDGVAPRLQDGAYAKEDPPSSPRGARNRARLDVGTRRRTR